MLVKVIIATVPHGFRADQWQLDKVAVMNKQNPTPIRIGWISSYVPKRCGIATFSRDLLEGIELSDPTVQVNIIAAEADDDNLTYGPRVIGTTLSSSRGSFVQAGRKLAALDPDVMVVQHEFGLFGGAMTNFERGGKQHHYPTGDNIFALLETVSAPVVATLHTVLPDPDPERRATIQRLAKYAKVLITMTGDAKRLLATAYGVDAEQVMVIPHGVPTVGTLKSSVAKRRLKLPVDEPIMMITGLIGGNKGVDIALKALPAILERYPKLKLYVVGQTHPQILAYSGEAYREGLMKLAQKLGVDQNLVFVNQYLPVDELVEYLQAADIYLTLHGDPEQAASGTLAYAMGAGLVAISTPYRYAQEVLDEGRGFLVPFGDSKALGETVNNLLGDAKLFQTTRRLAMEYGAAMSWPIVGRTYATLLHKVAQERKNAPQTVHEHSLF